MCQRASPHVVTNIENSCGILDKTLRDPSPIVMHDCLLFRHKVDETPSAQRFVQLMEMGR